MMPMPWWCSCSDDALMMPMPWWCSWASSVLVMITSSHDDVKIWICFPHYQPFLWGVHRSLVDAPHKGPVMQSFDISFDISLKKLLSKHSSGWWSETPWHSCDTSVMRLGPFWDADLPKSSWLRLRQNLFNKNIQVPYQVHMSFLEIQITL